MSNNVINKLSRRQTLNLLGVGGFSTAFMVGSQAIAKDPNKLPPFLQEWADIQNTQDPVAMASLFTEDGVIEAIPFKQVIQGRYNIQRFFEGVFQTLTNVSVEIVNGFATSKWAATDYNFIATNIGLVSAPSALNKSFNVRSSSLLKLKNNKIEYYNENFDVAEILLQVGVISSPFSITSCSVSDGGIK